MAFATREEWLISAVSELRPVFSGQGLTLPGNIRITCGFPLGHRRSGVLGECWADSESRDKTFEILIAPTVDDPDEVFAEVCHQLICATPGAMSHGTAFQNAAQILGLIPKASDWKHTKAGPGFLERYGALVEDLGPYPHAALNLSQRPPEPTRLLKAWCPQCKYTIRLSQKWVSKGLPFCPVDAGVQFINQ